MLILMLVNNDLQLLYLSVVGLEKSCFWHGQLHHLSVSFTQFDATPLYLAFHQRPLGSKRKPRLPAIALSSVLSE